VTVYETSERNGNPTVVGVLIEHDHVPSALQNPITRK